MSSGDGWMEGIKEPIRGVADGPSGEGNKKKKKKKN
jgi:hypothetical protein